jgi:hypothetical protein
MATTKNQIMDYLQYSAEEHEGRFFQSYWAWCTKYGQYPSIIQQLMANSQINRWYMNEYEKAEKAFIKMYEANPNAQLETLRAYYNANIGEILQRYPKPLVDDIKRNRDFSNIFLTNSPVYNAK